MKEELFGRHGTVNAETAIYTYGEMVYRLALIQMKNRSEADDVFQEVFLRLVKYKDRIRSEEHLKAWLLRVTLNCCKKEFDKAFRRKTVAKKVMRWRCRVIRCMKRFLHFRRIIKASCTCSIMSSIPCGRSARFWKFQSLSSRRGFTVDARC